MSHKHEITEDGEIYISHVLAKKRFKASKKQLSVWAQEGKVRVLSRELVRMPHQLMNDPQLELHFYHQGDIEKQLSGAEGEKA